MSSEKRAIIEIETKVPPEEIWQESENWWIETTKYYGARQSRVFKGKRWILIADFPSPAAAARFTGMLNRAEMRVVESRMIS